MRFAALVLTALVTSCTSIQHSQLSTSSFTYFGDASSPAGAVLARNQGIPLVIGSYSPRATTHHDVVSPVAEDGLPASIVTVSHVSGVWAGSKPAPSAERMRTVSEVVSDPNQAATATLAPSAPNSTPTPKYRPRVWVVSVDTQLVKHSASESLEALSARGLTGRIDWIGEVSGKDLYRVSVSGFADHETAAAFAENVLPTMDLPGAWVLSE